MSTTSMIEIAPQSTVLDGKIHIHDGERPEDSNPISRVTFGVASRLVCCIRPKKIPLDDSDRMKPKYKGKKTKEGPLFEHKDLFRFTDDEAYSVWKTFKPNWERELSEKEPSLIRALRRSFWKTFAASYILALIYVLFSLAVPVLMPYMLGHLADPTQPEWHGYVYVVAIVVAAVIAAIHYYHATFHSWRLAAKVRAALIILTYKKALKVQSSGGKDSGKIVNMVSVDAQILSDTMVVVLLGLVAPVQLAIITGLLWKEIGAFALLPLGTFLFSFPFVGLLNKNYGNLVHKAKLATDSRLKLVREFISAIRIVKYYAWERAFEKNIGEFRDREVNRIKDTTFIRVAGVSVFAAVSPISTGLVFSLYAIGNTLSVNNVFTALSLLNQLRVPLQFLPLVIVFWSQYNVAFTRVRDFALLPELPKHSTTVSSEAKKSNTIVQLKSSIGWEKDKPVLSNVTMKVKRGTVTMIVGSVGSGKSTLASAIISEVPFIDGEHKVNGSIAYVPQEAWIINATVRDNILFGKPYDEALYRRVISASALEPDFKIMPAGDQTEIGDRGINLSGGQRQRVSIARALYADRDLIVFDDPLSAVDSHVAAHLVEQVVEGYIKKRGKTAVMVTNQLQFLKAADQVILLKDGKVAEQGNFHDLRANGKDFAQLVKDFGGIDSSDEDSPKHGTTQANPDLVSPPIAHTRSKKSSSKKSTKKTQDSKTTTTTTTTTTSGGLTSAEEIESGAVSASVYWYYIRAGGALWFLLSAFLMFGIAAIRVFHSLWISWWTNPDPAISGQYVKETWIGVYMGMLAAEAALYFLRQLPLIFWSRNGSSVIHRQFLGSLSRATTGFFDATPMGRLLSRFSKDMYLIDDALVFQIDSYVQQIATLTALFAQMAATQPYLLIVIGASLIIFYTIQRVFQRTAIEIQRLEAVSRAPIFSHLSESVEGASSIRAYGLQKAFFRSSINKVNANIVDYLSLRYSTSWFGLRLDWVGTCIILATFLSVMLTRNYGTLDFALAALAMSSTSAITATLSSMANFAIQVETVMNSVERVRQYMEVEQEAPEHIEDTKPAETWPEKGAVRFKDLTIQYTEGAPVLKKVDASIKPREKIGIVGRTGAGKSTLITALFRMVEPASGTIKIDGVDIGQLGLADLRSKLAIIPQMPQLFIGTIRYNIDPFGEASDEQIWNSLDMVQLKDFVGSLDDKLEAKVEENGSNFSQGQRQLIAMARALLRDAKVLLLDEATAAVDNETDSMIQAMVRKNFKNKTVLTIAHRLNTIMDSTRVLVLDKGQVVEFDTPAKLLENKDGIFTSMVDATGPSNAEHLRKIARGELSVV